MSLPDPSRRGTSCRWRTRAASGPLPLRAAGRAGGTGRSEGRGGRQAARRKGRGTGPAPPLRGQPAWPDVAADRTAAVLGPWRQPLPAARGASARECSASWGASGSATHSSSPAASASCFSDRRLQHATLPLDGGLQVDPTPSALVVEADGGETFATRGVFKGAKVTAADLPPHLAQAIVAIEDRRFYSHGASIHGACCARPGAMAGRRHARGRQHHHPADGAAHLSPDAEPAPQDPGGLLALWLESQLSKEEILLRYLNTAYFGAGAYGVDAAARRYFGKARRP